VRRALAPTLALLLVALAACAPGAPPSAAPKSAATAAPAPTAAQPSPAVAAAPTAAPPASAAPERVRVGNVKSISDAPIFVGLDRGYFRELGLDVEWVEFQTAADMVAPLATGELDIGGGGFSAGFVNAAQRAIGMKIVANKGVQLPERSAVTLALRQDLAESGEVQTAADLRGRSVAVNAPGNVSDFYVERALRDAGLGKEAVNETILSLPAMITAFGNRSLDAGTLIDPLTTVAVRRGVAVRWLEAGAIYPRHETAALFYGASFTGPRAAAAQRFMVGWLRGTRAYEDAFSRGVERDAVLALLARETGLEQAVIEAIPPLYINPDGHVNTAQIDELQDFFLARGLIPRKSPIGDLVDLQYVEHALRQLGPYR
jgi:ABC-type nitrate/sulfonate/bicarbonate transport system substrate-binding protein